MICPAVNEPAAVTLKLSVTVPCLTGFTSWPHAIFMAKFWMQGFDFNNNIRR